MARKVMLAVTLLFIAALLFLTVYAATVRGVDAFIVLTALVLLLLGIGIAGALGTMPRKPRD